MGESRRKKQRGATPDYILKHTTKSLIASMTETVAEAKQLAASRGVGNPKALGLFEQPHPYHEILKLRMWMDAQDVAIQVLVRQAETGEYVTLNHDVTK